MNNGVPNDATLAAVLIFGLFAAILAVIAEKTHFFPRAVRWIQKDPVVRTALVVLLFAIGPITARTKNGQMSLPRPPLLFQVVEPPPEPAMAPVSVWTNGVALRAESTNAVEITAFRTIGGTELGDWIETAAPFFAVGTNPVNRCFVSASGSVSFDSMRRPPVGSALPDGTGLPVLCPLRTHLGFVPEANCPLLQTENGQPEKGNGGECRSRFWHDALPGGGRVLTWENALVDRLPGRRVTLQVEMRPTGDSVFRYDFHDALNPPPTNFVMGAQFGTNGVNALSILGTNTLAATVWNVDGAPVTNGVSIADLLCTNGVLRTPAAFEIRWKNTTGLDPEADTDSDGLTDWAETFVLGTDPNHADTDGDGTADNVEMMMGADPFDADEDGDGVPDGTSATAWGDNALWASNATNTAHAITITLNSAVPAGASASLMVGSLCIPLRSPGSWSLGLVPGELYPYRLVVGGNASVDLSIEPGETAPPMRGGGTASSASPPLWENGQGGVFDGGSAGGSGQMAIPTLSLVWIDSNDGSHLNGYGEVCLHNGTEAVFSPSLVPAFNPDWILDNLTADHGHLILDVPDTGVTYTGTAALAPGILRFGVLVAAVSAHRCDASGDSPYCSICGHYVPTDIDVYFRTPLTLKHDNQTAISIAHTNAPGETHTNGVIEIRYKYGDGEWWELGNESNLQPWTARFPGVFEIRGKITDSGSVWTTPSHDLNVRYPSAEEISLDPEVIQRATQEWAETLNDCSSETGKSRERGYWIVLDTRTGHYGAENPFQGPLVYPWERASTPISEMPPNRWSDPSNQQGGAVYAVAGFHTHPPTTYWPTNLLGRPVGPSEDGDIPQAAQLNMPGLVFDYEPDPVFSALAHTNAIPAGWPTNAPARLYTLTPPERRPNQ